MIITRACASTRPLRVCVSANTDVQFVHPTLTCILSVGGDKAVRASCALLRSEQSDSDTFDCLGRSKIRISVSAIKPLLWPIECASGFHSKSCAMWPFAHKYRQRRGEGRIGKGQREKERELCCKILWPAASGEAVLDDQFCMCVSDSRLMAAQS